MRTITVEESTSALIELSVAEAKALQQLGSRLASKKEWWGAESDTTQERSVIRCRPDASGLWEVRVSDAVGLISTGELQLLVEPKIPASHLLHLFCRSGEFPRLEDQRGLVASGASLWELVATWFVGTTEKVIRRDLVRDYQPAVDDLPSVRGKIDALTTARHFYSGRLQVGCAFEEFAHDSPLNRAIRAAARVISASASLSKSVRRRARGIVARMEDIGEFDASDRWPTLDRRTAHYRDALILAGHVLRTEARDLRSGEVEAWTFLIRTPEMVEAGILSILQDTGIHYLSKRSIGIENTALTLNPDIVVDNGAAIADVKYKIARREWGRSDLYQIVAFATGYRATQAALISFKTQADDTPPMLTIGDVHVRHIAWNAYALTSAVDAEARFVSDFADWAGSFSGRASSSAA